MRIEMTIDKAAALAAGKDEYGQLVLEVPAVMLTAAERALLAACAVCPGESRRDPTGRPVPVADYALPDTSYRGPSVRYAPLAEASLTAVQSRLAEIARLPATQAAILAAWIEEAVRKLLALDQPEQWCRMVSYGGEGEWATAYRRPYVDPHVAEAVWADPRVGAHEAAMRTAAQPLLDAETARAATARARAKAADEARAAMQPEIDALTRRVEALTHALGLLPPDALTGLVRALAAETTGDAEAAAQRRLRTASGGALFADAEDEEEDEHDDE